MAPTLAFAPTREDLDEGYFDLPVLVWSAPVADPRPQADQQTAKPEPRADQPLPVLAD